MDDKRIDLYMQGFDDKEIGDALGYTPEAVHCWRRKNKLPANEKSGWCQRKCLATRRKTYPIRFEMYNAGASDYEIAEAVGRTVGAIQTWRYRNKLKCNRKQ